MRSVVKNKIYKYFFYEQKKITLAINLFFPRSDFRNIYSSEMKLKNISSWRNYFFYKIYFSFYKINFLTTKYFSTKIFYKINFWIKNFIFFRCCEKNCLKSANFAKLGKMRIFGCFLQILKKGQKRVKKRQKTIP